MSSLSARTRDPGVFRLRQPGEYVWEAPNRVVSIHLSLDVVARLEREAVEATRAIASKGVEVGGILLGSLRDGVLPTVAIDDYELVPCDHHRGPLYRLAEVDKERFRAAIRARGADVVGFFRSNVRPELAFRDEDKMLAAELFPSPRQVFLLVKPAPAPARAGFFFWDGGVIHGERSCLEFPFRVAELAGAAALGDPAASPLFELRPAPRPAPEKFRAIPTPLNSSEARVAVPAESAAQFAAPVPLAQPMRSPEPALVKNGLAEPAESDPIDLAPAKSESRAAISPRSDPPVPDPGVSSRGTRKVLLVAGALVGLAAGIAALIPVLNQFQKSPPAQMASTSPTPAPPPLVAPSQQAAGEQSALVPEPSPAPVQASPQAPPVEAAKAPPPPSARPMIQALTTAQPQPAPGPILAEPPVSNAASFRPGSGPAGVTPPSTDPVAAPIPVGLGSTASAAQPDMPKPAATQTAPSKPQALRVLKSQPPIYPPAARSARVQGTVTVAVTVGKDGRVKEAHAVAGPQLLQWVAVGAVRNWLFEPPVEDVVTQVAVTFTP